MESTLVDQLAPATRPELVDADWVRPGRAAWSWWSGFFSGAQESVQRQFVDFAARSGWEHLLIDCGWEDSWVPEIVSYASLCGIQVHLWCVGTTSTGRRSSRGWSSGVRGVLPESRSTSWSRSTKDRYRWYDSVLQETARLGLMVNFHGSVIPRGWARTWPHVIAYEAIRGAEYYVFYRGTPLTASHNVIQPFTRNVVGAMDYTPVAFTAPDRCDERRPRARALGRVRERHPHLRRPRRGLRARSRSLPASWRSCRRSGTRRCCWPALPTAKPVLARRRGDRWFIGAIATGEPRTLRVPLARLGLSDPQGVGGRRRGRRAARVRGASRRRAGRGCRRARRIRGDPDRGRRAHPPGRRASDRAATVRRTVACRAQRRDRRVVPPTRMRASASRRGGARLQQQPGRLDASARPSSPQELLGVVSVELPGSHGIARIAHARLVAPLTDGIHRAPPCRCSRSRTSSVPSSAT